jgi:hypothetical protein
VRPGTRAGHRLDTKRPRADENGEPLYVIQLLAMGDGSADLLAVKVPGVLSPAIRQGAPVKVAGLVAQPWTMADRSGVSFRAARVEPAITPSQGQLTEGRDARNPDQRRRRRGRQTGCWEPGRPLHQPGPGCVNTRPLHQEWSP